MKRNFTVRWRLQPKRAVPPLPTTQGIQPYLWMHSYYCAGGFYIYEVVYNSLLLNKGKTNAFYEGLNSLLGYIVKGRWIANAERLIPHCRKKKLFPIQALLSCACCWGQVAGLLLAAVCMKPGTELLQQWLCEERRDLPLPSGGAHLQLTKACWKPSVEHPELGLLA